ncbi:hypothetical protein [Pedobacter sp. Hv1]|uniref:hypothetical protein n=1 Tax=Pedobacter sp. Hv1 TaxID=1740090 RepID=UPI0006D8CA49|nr:hypothetical protein [Pedobacter sp. Hv1]KQB99913.1 hypothetical protein AQF98_15490 [Pedobacter sp. Hv1]
MKNLKLIAVLFFICLAYSASALIPLQPVITGQQPNIAIDTKGTVRMVYGDGENIYCITLTDNGAKFSKPVFVASLTGMHLGNTRGPQIASSLSSSVIAAMDKDGNIHTYRLEHTKNIWRKGANVNDISKSAPEGLMGLTADRNNNFYAVWLDLRTDKMNNIYFSALQAKSMKWSKNKLVYRSPEGHTCECCRPNIIAKNNKLVITFRNWLAGSRDIYYASSTNMGKTFTQAAKTGMGTWKLNACPMDGGGVSIDEKGVVSTAWQRNGQIFYWNEQKAERSLGNGRSVSMAQRGNKTLIAWQEKDDIKVADIVKGTTKVIGKGTHPRIYLLGNGKSLCVWENNKTVKHILL